MTPHTPEGAHMVSNRTSLAIPAPVQCDRGGARSHWRTSRSQQAPWADEQRPESPAMQLPETIRVHVTLVALEKGDPRRIGPYRLRARAGVGGMGVVYLGIGPRDGRVAVKVLRRELAESPQFRSRFVREIAAAARVDAACTARFVSADATSTQPWFATEYIRGPSLEAFVAEHGALPATAVRAFAVGVADALAAIGRARLVHRDLKPTNVLLTRSGPRVIDFGIALEDDDTAPFTELDEPTGTVGWMAPEQVREGCSTPATDVFAWGALVAYAASGTPPFGVGDTETVLHRVLYAEPVLQALQPDLEPVVRTALSKDPAARPSTEQLLRTLLHAPPGTGRRALSERVDALLAATWRVGVLPGEETLPRRSTPRRRLAAAAAGVAVIAGTIAAVATLVGGTSHAHPVAVSTATTAATTSTSTTTTSTTTTTTAPTTTTTIP